MISANPSKNCLKILLIEDNQGDQILAKKRIEKGLAEQFVDCFFASTLEDGIKILSSNSIHVILLDLNLPDSFGLLSVKTLKESFPETSLIVLTGWEDRRTSIESLHLGAQDYLIKGTYTATSLAWSIRSAMTRQENVNEIERLKKTDEQKLEFKDKILSMTAHDIRGSLVGVIGFLKNIVAGDMLDDLRSDQKRIFDLMLKNCEIVVSLSDEIVRARRENSLEIKVNRQPISIRKFLEDIRNELEVHSHSKNIQIKTQTQLINDCFNLDDHLISRALKNLIQNAIKYSPRDSEIELIAKNDGNDDLILSVKDSGQGIESDKIENLFEEVRHLDPKDPQACYHGLGLVIVKRIVEAHEGEIDVKTGLARGTEFHIWLPAKDNKTKSID